MVGEDKEHIGWDFFAAKIFCCRMNYQKVFFSAF
jgi:hypothetical protein